MQRRQRGGGFMIRDAGFGINLTSVLPDEMCKPRVTSIGTQPRLALGGTS